MKSKKVRTIGCNAAAKYICENLDEKANSPFCRRIRKHLQECPDCSLQLSFLKKIVSLYRDYPDTKISESGHKALMAKLSADK
jgi:predicted anti-sigma-YlaC factor YlaD